MANTYTLIQSVTVGSGGAASIDFTSIPQTYTDLMLVISMRTTNASVADYASVSFNSSTTSYALRLVSGDGSAASSSSFTTSPNYRIINAVVGDNATANVFSTGSLYMPNYTSSNNKSYSVDFSRENNTTGNEMSLGAGLWSNSAAVTSITLTSWAGATIKQYSSASLYGIKNS